VIRAGDRESHDTGAGGNRSRRLAASPVAVDGSTKKTSRSVEVWNWCMLLRTETVAVPESESIGLAVSRQGVRVKRRNVSGDAQA